MTRSAAAVIVALVLSGYAVSSPRAETIIDEWGTVKIPAPPTLKAIKLDPATTALLLLDFNGHTEATSGPCNATNKPRCLATLPKMRELLTKARTSGMFVVYSLSSIGRPADIRPEVAPKPDEPSVKSGPNKFIGTNLRELLTARNIRTVIVTGTASEGAVLATATDAALNGFKIVVPVDGMSSTEPYAEQYVAWHMTAAPGVSPQATLTRIDMIDF